MNITSSLKNTVPPLKIHSAGLYRVLGLPTAFTICYTLIVSPLKPMSPATIKSHGAFF